MENNWQGRGTRGEQGREFFPALNTLQVHEGRFVGRMREGVQPKGSGGHSVLAY